MASPTSPAAGPVRQADQARHLAHQILGEARFHAPPVPRPLHGVLQAIGDALQSPLGVLEELVETLGAGTPGGTTAVWGVLAAVLLLACALLATRGARRALGQRGEGEGDVDAARPPSAAELERAAAAAEGAGDHGEAVRLRFRAGLIRLGESERVAFVPSMSNTEVSRALRSPRFDGLARRFEEVVYGGQRAREDDAELARRDWQRLFSSKESP
jgi:hypothetical protein